MLTKNEAIKRCIMEYAELWGSDWVTSRIDSFIEDTCNPIGTNELLFGIAQDDSYARSEPITYEEFSKVTFGGNSGRKPQHYTRFKIDLETGELETLEHY